MGHLHGGLNFQDQKYGGEASGTVYNDNTAETLWDSLPPLSRSEFPEIIFRKPRIR